MAAALPGLGTISDVGGSGSDVGSSGSTPGSADVTSSLGSGGGSPTTDATSTNDANYQAALGQLTNLQQQAAPPTPSATANPNTASGGTGGTSPQWNQLQQAYQSWLGVPYVYGGTSKSGVDCSGFTSSIYNSLGLNIGRNTTAQMASPLGHAVGTDGNWNSVQGQLQPGDLIFYGQPGASGPNAHVVMYIGNGQVVQAAHTGTNVAVGPMFSQASSNEPFAGVRRYLQPGAAGATGPTSGGAMAPYNGAPINNTTDFAKALLGVLGDPTSAANIASLVNWQNHEGGHWHNTAYYNPLNTTLNYDGDPGMNSVNVRQYASWAEGLAATKQTLQNGLYNDILAALANGGGLGHGYYQSLGKWSGGGYYTI